MTPDQGPVIDWLAQRWDALLAMVKAFLTWLAAMPARLEARVDSLEEKFLIGGGVAVAVFFLGLLLHAFITRPPRPVKL